MMRCECSSEAAECPGGDGGCPGAAGVDAGCCGCPTMEQEGRSVAAKGLPTGDAWTPSVVGSHDSLGKRWPGAWLAKKERVERPCWCARGRARQGHSGTR